jgi:hypothetical protein
MFPKDKTGFEMDEQYYIGSSGLLVKPITAKGVTETKVYLAEDQVRDISLLLPRPFTSSDPGRFIMITSTIMPIVGRLRAKKSLFQLHFTKSLPLSVADPLFQLVNGHDDHHR